MPPPLFPPRRRQSALVRPGQLVAAVAAVACCCTCAFVALQRVTKRADDAALSAARLATPLLAARQPVPGSVAALLAGLTGGGAAAASLPLPDLAPGSGYPRLFPLSVILAEWNPSVASKPPTWSRYHSLKRFDWLSQRDAAAVFRELELPFVLTRLPAVREAVAAWAEDEDVVSSAPEGASFPADVSTSSSFTYFSRREVAVADAAARARFRAPTVDEELTLQEWFSEAAVEKAAQLAAERAALPGWWFAAGRRGARARAGAVGGGVLRPPRPPRRVAYLRPTWRPRGDNATATQWIVDALPHFDVSPRGVPWGAPFFVGTTGGAPANNDTRRGGGDIFCRLTTCGAVATAHFDESRNFVSVLRGAKRFVLLPPSECAAARLARAGPLRRHATFDWGDPSELWKLGPALGTEVVLSAGDTLYLPAYWTHLVASLDTSIQCNARPGSPPPGLLGWGAANGAPPPPCSGPPAYPEPDDGGGGGWVDPLPTSPSAPAFQPRRAAHRGEWAPAWPTADQVARGLRLDGAG